MNVNSRCIPRYCPLLGRNVIMETQKDLNGYTLECLSKAECGFCEEGCRNILLAKNSCKDCAANAEIP